MCDKVVDPTKLNNTGYDISRKAEKDQLFKLGPRYLPYAEKHKIYELFQEIIAAMMLELPDDHVLFIQDYLEQAAFNRDTSRVFVYGPPYYDVEKFVYKLAEIAGLNVFRRSEALNYETNQPIRNPKKFAERVKDLITEPEEVTNPCKKDNTPLFKKGWIFFEMPLSRAECTEFKNVGIDPTHVLYLMTCVMPPFKRLSFHDIPMNWHVFKHHVVGIRDIYKDIFREVNVGNRDIPCLAVDCAEIINVKKTSGVQMLPRVVIIGKRGSGRKTQAKMLARRLNLVYIDFEDLFNIAKEKDNEVGRKIRGWNNFKEYTSDLLIRILEERIYENDCINRGWVVVGYPNTVDDFLALDLTDTPPSRVIYLQVPCHICRDRILRRRVDQISGQIYHLDSVFPLTKEQNNNLAVHPRDKETYVLTEIEYYLKHVDKMKAYTGNTATEVNGVGKIEEIFKYVESVIIRPVLPCPPRNPYSFKPQEPPAADIQSHLKFAETTEFAKGSVNLEDYNVSMSLSQDSKDVAVAVNQTMKSTESVHNLLDEQKMAAVGSTYSKPDAAAIMADGSKAEVLLSTTSPEFSNTSYQAKPRLSKNLKQLSPISEKEET